MMTAAPGIRRRRWLALTLASLAVCAGSAWAQQDSLARAKDFYASAAYEEALQLLTTLPADKSSGQTEITAYQVFCLVALGRSAEANRAIESLVRIDPLYHPSEAQASPRIRAFFENARRPLLPSMLRDSYSRARTAFERKELSKSQAEFDRVIALLDEIGDTDDQGISDLRTLASGFRDLVKIAVAEADAAAAAAAAAKAAAPATPPPAPTAPAAPKIYGLADTTVVRPVAVSRFIPPWQPVNPFDRRREFTGTIEVIVDERGKVTSSRMVLSVHATFDPVLLQAAKTWTFKPATKDGVPVPYRFTVEIRLAPVDR